MGHVKYFFDTEFIEWEGGLDLISIGIISEDGREFYAEVADAEIPWDKADPWVLANVRPHLHQSAKWSKKDLAYEILSFTSVDPAKPQFWAYYADYDWVIFCRLFGRMVDLPQIYPQYCMDIKQWCVELGDPRLPEQFGTKHDALEDARWNRAAYEFLKDFEARGATSKKVPSPA